MDTKNNFHFYFSKLSVRAKTVCLNYSLLNQEAFYKFMKVHQDFRRLRNCGALTNSELLDFYDKIKSDDDEKVLIIEVTEEPKGLSLNDLSDAAYNDLCNWYYIRLNKLSIRAKNAISYLQQQKTVSEFITDILRKDFDATSIRNVGRKTAGEINKLIYDIRLFIQEISISEGESSKSFSLKMKRLFNIDIETTNVEDSKNDNVLLYLKSIVQQSTQLSRTEKATFINLYYDKLSVEEIALRIGKSQERIRQIVKKNLPHKIKPIINQLSDKFLIFNELHLLIQEDYHCYSTQALKEFHINSTYKAIPFSLFIEYICPNIVEFGYSFINIEEPLLLACVSGHFRYQWYTERRYPKYYWFYVEEHISFDSLRKMLSEILITFTSENKKDWILEWSALSQEINEKQKILISEILFKEFGITTIKRGIYINRNTRVCIDELAFNALESIGEMSTIDEILNFIKINNSNASIKKLNASTLRNIITKRKDLFIYERRRGRSSYGLKLWEHLKGFKGGTIKGLVIEFLLKQQKPIHISVIGAYINQFRPETNDYSILQNLKLDSKGRFQFYRGGFVGINKSKLCLHESGYELVTIEELINDIFDY